MKKFLFSLLTVAGTFTYISAQQMSYYPNMVGTPGQSFIIANDDTLLASDMNFNTGSVGAGIIWNFQGLDFDGLDTMNFVSLTPQEAIDFPSGTMVNESNIGRIVFEEDDATGLFLQGSNLDFQGVPLSLNYNPAQQTLPAVTSLGSSVNTVSYVDETVYVGIDTNVLGCQVTIDSIQLKREADYTVNFNSTGELRLPLDTFAYALCGISKEITVDSIFVFCPTGISGGTCGTFGLNAPVGWGLAPDILIQLSGFAAGAVVHDSSYTASWYAPYTIAPLCIMDFTYDSAYLDTSYLGIKFKALNTPDIGFEQVDMIDLNIFPNPASTLLMLQTNAILTDATMYIYNAQGQQVKAVVLNGTNAVDVSTLTDGSYFYQLADGTKLLHHGKFMVKK